MLDHKRTLTIDDIDAQQALELPDRETLALVTATCLAVCVGSISVTVQNVHVAAAVCASVQAITALTGSSISCTVSA
jgi:hypothetical protein